MAELLISSDGCSLSTGVGSHAQLDAEFIVYHIFSPKSLWIGVDTRYTSPEAVRSLDRTLRAEFRFHLSIYFQPNDSEVRFLYLVVVKWQQHHVRRSYSRQDMRRIIFVSCRDSAASVRAYAAKWRILGIFSRTVGRRRSGPRLQASVLSIEVPNIRSRGESNDFPANLYTG